VGSKRHTDEFKVVVVRQLTGRGFKVAEEAGVLAGTVHGTPFDPRPQPIDSPPRPPAGGLRAWSPKAGYLSRSAIRRNG